MPTFNDPNITNIWFVPTPLKPARIRNRRDSHLATAADHFRTASGRLHSMPIDVKSITSMYLVCFGRLCPSETHSRSNHSHIMTCKLRFARSNTIPRTIQKRKQWTWWRTSDTGERYFVAKKSQEIYEALELAVLTTVHGSIRETTFFLVPQTINTGVQSLFTGQADETIVSLLNGFIYCNLPFHYLQWNLT